MGLKKLLSWLLVLVLMLATVAGCKASGPNAIELVPQGANLIARIQVSRIINDQDLRNAYDEAEKEPGQPQTFEEALDEIDNETGIDLHDFSQAVIFADITTIEQASYLGVIIEGSVAEEQFIDNIEDKMGAEFTTSDYKGYKLYTIYTDEEAEFVIAFLSDSMLLLGTTEAVKDAIDVSKGDVEPVGGIILDAYNRLGDALIKLAFEFPEEEREALAEGFVPSETPISLESFADIDMIGFSINKEADTITTKIESHFLSIDSAQDAKDALSGAISLFKGLLQDPEIKELLGKMEVTATDSWMTIALELTVSEIEELIVSFSQEFQQGANLTAANTEAANVKTAALAYHAENGVWPATSNELYPIYLIGELDGFYVFDMDSGEIIMAIPGTGITSGFTWDAGTQSWVMP
jgi:hypothetical protein